MAKTDEKPVAEKKGEKEETKDEKAKKEKEPELVRLM